MTKEAEIAIIGAGAAGLMAAVWAARASGGVVALDGAKKIGAKILVAGGGRCNVTHDVVSEEAYAGASRHAIRKVLRRFDVPEVREFFAALGVELKREETGKLFPVSDDARTVLHALLGAVGDAGATVVNPWRVASVRRVERGFVVEREGDGAGQGAEAFVVKRVILATGGKSLPRTGSDGHGYEIARSLGHSVTPTFPALVPLVLPSGHWVTALSGLTVPATLELRSGTGKRIVSFTDSTLLTHFGLSGPGVLDISRYYAEAKKHDSGAALVVSWLPGAGLEPLDAELRAMGRTSPMRALQERGLPERLARAICAAAGVDPVEPGHALSREARRGLATMVVGCPLPVAGDRGYTYAEVTAGGVPLTEVRLETMESRVCPGLHLCGEILDVDGRIGGYNFQWAWASGFVAGSAAGLGE